MKMEYASDKGASEKRYDAFYEILPKNCSTSVTVDTCSVWTVRKKENSENPPGRRSHEWVFFACTLCQINEEDANAEGASEKQCDLLVKFIQKSLEMRQKKSSIMRGLDEKTWKANMRRNDALTNVCLWRVPWAKR